MASSSEREKTKMMLPFPVKFDLNELWVLFGMFILVIVFLMLPKRFPPVLTFNILLFTAFISITVDYLLASDYPFNFYDALDTAKYDLFDFLMDTINYSLYGYLFIYFYDRYHPRWIKLVLYFVFWIGLSLGFEWVSMKLNVFRYYQWNLAYSSVAYLIIFIFYILFLKLSKLGMKLISN